MTAQVQPTEAIPAHHLWDWSLVPRHAPDRYNIIGTVYMGCGAFCRADGPRERALVGDVESY